MLATMSAAFDPGAFNYRAFLSYARADSAVVDDMFRRLIGFRTPRALMRGTGDFGAPPRALRLFLDRKSAQLGARIPDRLQSAVADSAFLVVFCSPAARTSAWVAQEIEEFLKRAPAERILPVFLRLSAQDPIAPLLPAPLAALGDDLPIGGDLVVDGGPLPVAHKLLGAMLGFPQDLIAREQEAEDKRRRALERGALAAIAGLASAAAIASGLALNEAKKAATSLEVSLGALDRTTPFAAGLVAQGRVTMAEAASFSGQLDRVFGSFSETDLRQLPDIRFSLGQVLQTSARLNAQIGDLEAWRRDSARALALLEPFTTEPGPLPQSLICDAALELAAANAALLRFAESAAALERCETIAQSELRHHQDIALAAPLLARLVMAAEMRARALLAQDDFRGALEALDVALGPDRLGALTALATPAAEEEALRLRGRLAAARGAVFEMSERYAEARAAYEEAQRLFAQSGLGILDMLPTEQGLARAMGLAEGTQAAGIARFGVLAAALEGALARDPAHRALEAAFVQVLIDRAALRIDDPAGAPAASAIAGHVYEDLTRAGEIMARLLAFDDANPHWRALEAWRLSVLADFYFRLDEAYGAQAPVCAGRCLALAAATFRDALSANPAVTPGMIHQQVEMELRLARVLRHAGGDAEAKIWIDRAAQSHARVRALAPASRALDLQSARIADEEADLLMAAGRPGEAAALYADALAVHEEAAGAEPEWISVRRDLLWSHLRLAEALAASGDQAAARAAFDAACAEERRSRALPSRLAQQDRARLAAAAASAGRPCSVSE